MLIPCSPLLAATRPGLEESLNAVCLNDGSIAVLSSLGEQNPIFLFDGANTLTATIAHPLTSRISVLNYRVDEDFGFKPARPGWMEGVTCLVRHGLFQRRYKAQINPERGTLKYPYASDFKNHKRRRQDPKIPFGAAIFSRDREKFFGFVLDEIEPNIYDVAFVVEA